MQNEYRETESIMQFMTTPEKEVGIVVSFSNGCVVITGFLEIMINEKIIFYSWTFFYYCFSIL